MTKRADPVRSVAEHRRELSRRLKLAFIAGAEERSRSAWGRGLTDAELRRVLQTYPGDLPERQARVTEPPPRR